MGKLELKSLLKTTLMAGAVTLVATDLTPKSWQAKADDEQIKTSTDVHGCGEGACGSETPEATDAKKKQKISDADAEAETKGTEKSCGGHGCGEGSCG